VRDYLNNTKINILGYFSYKLYFKSYKK